VDECLRWGDDYELLFTLPDGITPPVAASRIGTVGPKDIAALYLDGNIVTPADKLGYQH
jgi:thiamine-monophosphate kinase